MRLPVQITLLLFAVITLFVIMVSAYFYAQINKNFTEQAEKQMLQDASLIEQRIETLKQNLQIEMEQLVSSLFTENESTLAAMLAKPPEFNAEVVEFAKKLQKRTTLDFLSLISSEGIILSSSPAPAVFGKKDPYPDFPVDEVACLYDQSTHLELRRKADFGKRSVILRGGYLLKYELDKLALPGPQIHVIEMDPEGILPKQPPPSNASWMTRTISLQDYLGRAVLQITVSTSKQELMQQRKKLIENSIMFIVLSIMICLLAGFGLSWSVSRPVARLRDAALEMSRGNLEARVEEKAGGEIAELIEAFNRMVAQLQENQRKLLQAERIAAWQEIARHLAHEIKNPLTPIRTSIANLRFCMEKAPEKFTEIFLESSESIVEEVEKLRHLADEFSRFARLPAPELKPGNLNEMVQKCLVLYGDDASVQIRFEPGELPVFSFDPEQLSEVVHNLLRNAVEAIDSGGMIKVKTDTLSRQQLLWVRLSVEDNGKGMDAEIRKQIFTPYFTTKEKGTGLGLAIVHRIVTEHGGSVLVESEPGKGTRFEVRLPSV